MTFAQRIRGSVLPLALVATLGMSACRSNVQTGVLSGAAAGAVVGGLSGGARGILIGAVVGGAAGGAIGAIMDAQADDLQDKLPGATVQRVGEGIAVTFDSGILFDVDSAELRDAAESNLRRLAASLAGLDSGRIVADGRGEEEPIADNATDIGRQENRRVEVAIFASEEMRAEMLRRHGGA